jgi:GNAT superfamily N-acetyltransferase
MCSSERRQCRVVRRTNVTEFEETQDPDMRIEPIFIDHRQGLVDFVGRISQQDRYFVDRTRISQVAVASWTQAVPERRLVAVEPEGSISGLLTISRGIGWTSHTADVRLVVDSTKRGRGIGRALASAGVDLAKSVGIEKLSVETMGVNTGAHATFLPLGFEVEARLPGGIRDDIGELQDIIILSRWLISESPAVPEPSSTVR